MLTFSRKDQEYGAGGIGVPGWASNRLTILDRSLKARPLHL